MVRPGLARMSLPRCWFRFPGWAGAEARRGRAIVARRLPSLSPWDAGERHGGLVRLCASLGPLTQHKRLPAGFPQCPHLCLAADPPTWTRSAARRSPAQRWETTRDGRPIGSDSDSNRPTAAGEFQAPALPNPLRVLQGLGRVSMSLGWLERPRALRRAAGCRGAQVEEIWSLEPENFEKLKPVHGLIFLFKWQPGEEPAGSVVQDSRLDTIFFAKQVINNACATQAIVSVLLNCTHQDVHLGETLSEFKEFSQSFDAAMKGLALSNSDVIRQVHNSFARQQMFEFDTKTSAKEEDAFHFVSYVPVNGRLYELDGLREGPIDLGACNQDDWISAVRPVIEKRIQKYSEGEIRFNLMAIVSDRKMIYEQKIAELQRQLAEEEPMDTDQGNSMLSAIQSEVAKNQMLIEEEVQKLKDTRLRISEGSIIICLSLWNC
ncbi:PREDICTED: ubiquitin carboxyl-terminal hydrolase isozyme L5 isoform X6 [Rhinopithecus bieti]|uniref:ubiquitin carboxyl-terminal hydrolase isozyme L5 isoform X6 n=1 Tax=Rhinopithecus bieti TaxID=61621 RepID=UPI00083C2CC0|nr:PREDICTED: ubiquitin carboxyl-terminal hydrolase isozyme L5 isoform X6 [Rhinopithecus bieti]